MDCKKAQSLVTAYIMRKLNDKDLEDFLEHVDSCEECYEELEIYYTVHYTIARLDEDEADQVYNVKKALQNRLEESRFYMEDKSFQDLPHWAHGTGGAASGCDPNDTGRSVAERNHGTQSDLSVFIHTQRRQKTGRDRV